MSLFAFICDDESGPCAPPLDAPLRFPPTPAAVEQCEERKPRRQAQGNCCSSKLIWIESSVLRSFQKPPLYSCLALAAAIQGFAVGGKAPTSLSRAHRSPSGSHQRRVGRRARRAHRASPTPAEVQAASCHSYRRCSPPTRGTATTFAVSEGRGVVEWSHCVFLPRPRCVRSS